MLDTGSHMSLEAWLDLLENRHVHEIQLGLGRVRDVANRMGLCDLNAPVITVAGTNGKGSTVAALEAIYHAAGFKVGSYTSPHLLMFNERIRVNQVSISDSVLCEAFCLIEKARGEIHLTYFEMTTLAALWHFKQCKLDVVILEVGMGGRLDATNIIDAALAIITTIDLDHQDFLGETIEAIGYEKAGILRENQFFIYADQKPPQSIVEKAHALNTRMFCLGIDYSYQTDDGLLLISNRNDEYLSLVNPAINLKAAAAAVVASQLLHTILPVSWFALNRAMSDVTLPGRLHIVPGDVRVVYDVAHNPQAALLLADFIRRQKGFGKVHAVFSGLKDKDLCGLIKAMCSCVDFWYPAALHSRRAANQPTLLAAFQAATTTVDVFFSSPAAAYFAAMQNAAPGDLIVVYGSFLTVSAVMAIQ